MNDIEIKSRLM